MIRALATYFKHHRHIALICAFLGSSLISISPLFIRYSEVNVATTAFFRFFFAIPLIWFWLIIENSQAKTHRNPTTITDYFWLVLSGIFLSLDITLWYLSIQYTTVINAVLLNNSCTVFVAILAWLIFGEKMTWQIIFGIALAVIGSIFLVGENFDLGNPDYIQGDIYGLLSAVFYALYIMVTKKLRHEFSTPTILMWSGLSSMYVLAVIAVLFHETLSPDVCQGCLLLPITLQGWLILIGLSFFVHIVGQGLMSYSMAYLTATLSALITLVGPLIGAGLGYFFFQESLTFMQIVGGAIVIFGIILSQYNRKKYKLT